jgi:neutral ceramidase
MNPGAGSPDLAGPAGPTDPTVSVLAFREPSGRPISVFASYSLHYVGGVGPGHISADYYGMYCGELARLLNAEHQDPPFVALLANGTSGDVNNINFLHPRPYKGPYVQMRAVADDVARKVCDALAKAKYQDYVTLAARYRELPVASRHPTPEEMDWAKKTLASPPGKPGEVDYSRIYAERTMNLAKSPAIVPIPLQVLRIGDVCLGSMPCEVFCEIGLDFKKRSPIQPAFLVSLAHGYFGYLPTPRQHELGGYETWLGTNQLERQASDKMLDALLEMAAEVKPEAKAEIKNASRSK